MGHGDVHKQCHDERGQQLVNREEAAQGREREFPDKDHRAAGNHTGHRALAVGALPEEGEQHDRAERGAEARPREGYDAKDGAVRIPGKGEGNKRNANDRQPGAVYPANRT